MKLAVLEDWNERRRRHAEAYRRDLAEVAELTLPASTEAGVDGVHHLFCVRHPHRERLAEHLAAQGIATQIHYPQPPHMSGAFANLGLVRGSFPVTEAACATILSLPIGPHLSVSDRDRVVAGVRAFAQDPSSSS